MKNRTRPPGWLLCSVLLVTLITTGCSGTPSPTEYTVQERILPSPYFVPTIIRAPIAWTRSTGAGVTVAVTRNHGEDLTLVNLVAPDAAVEPLEVDEEMHIGGETLADLLARRDIQILAIIEPSDFDPQSLRDTVRTLTRAGVAIFVNGNLSDTTEELELVNDLEAAGAITVGRLDLNGRARGRDLAQRQISLFAPYGTAFDRGAVLTAAGVGALVLAGQPALSPETLREHLVNTADEMYQASSLDTGAWNTSAVHVDQQTGDYSPTEQAFHFRRVNAAHAVGVHLDERWPVNALNAPAAWETATGRGVTVAVLDQGFHVNNPAFEGHLVDTAAFFPGQDFNGQQNFHGTAMAKIVLAIAPNVSLAFLHYSEQYGQMETVIQAFADAIDYAIESDVDVITSSAAPWPNTPEVHAAIDRAIEAGIVFVWFHYNGPNDDVIRPGHFLYPRWEVGAFDRFFDDDKPSDLEGGLSSTAPQIAGIAALILQNEPNLSPAEVKQRILQTATVLPNGNSIADAAAAVENRPSGRQLVGQTIAPAPGGHCHVVYQQPGTEGEIAVEIEEQGEHWSIPAWPRRDILLYRYAHEPCACLTTGSPTGAFVLEVHRDGDMWLVARLLGDRLTSGESPARVSLLPDGRMGPFYSLTLGEGEVKPLRVEVEGNRVRLVWENAEGVPMERFQRGEEGTPSDYRLYRFEIETQRLPDLFQTIY